MFQFLSRVSGIASHTKQKQRPASSTSTSIVDPPLHCKPPSPPLHTLVYVNSFAVTLLWRPISLIYANTTRATDSAWQKYKSTDVDSLRWP